MELTPTISHTVSKTENWQLNPSVIDASWSLNVIHMRFRHFDSYFTYFSISTIRPLSETKSTNSSLATLFIVTHCLWVTILKILELPYFPDYWAHLSESCITKI